MSEEVKKENSQRLRRSIKAQIDHAQAERRRELFRRRVEIARQGISNYQHREIAEAVQHFKGYISILEDWKGISPGSLTPAHFDFQKDQAELLLISGVYWDLVKLYDRTKTVENQNEFAHYLKQFILFSKNMPFQGMCAESMRKYIAYGGAIHKEQLKKAHQQIALSQCFVATELNEYLAPNTVPTLRAFRVHYLESREWGRQFSQWYRRKGRVLAEMVGLAPTVIKILFGKGLDLFAKMIRRYGLDSGKNLDQ